MESMESLPRAAAGLSTTVATSSDSASPGWRNMSLSLSVVTRDFSCLETDSESCIGRCFRWTYLCLYAILQIFKPLHLSRSLEAKVENDKNEGCVFQESHQNYIRNYMHITCVFMTAWEHLGRSRYCFGEACHPRRCQGSPSTSGWRFRCWFWYVYNYLIYLDIFRYIEIYWDIFRYI